MHCTLPKQIRPEGWHHWQKECEQTARYLEFENTGDGSAINKRVSWSHQLTKKEAKDNNGKGFPKKRRMAPLKDAILFIEVRLAVFSMPEGHHAHSSDASAPLLSCQHHHDWN